MKKINESLIKSEVKPFFADDIIIVTPIKAMKEGNKIKKEGHVVLIFMDMLSQKPVAKIALSKTTADSFRKVLTRVLSNLDKNLKSNEIPKPAQIKTTTTRYIE